MRLIPERRTALEVEEFMEKTEDASLAAEESLGPGPDADRLRLERLKRVVTVEVMEALVRREGVRVAFT